MINGCIAGRRRESAILVSQACTCRLCRSGHSNVTIYQDVANAFGHKQIISAVRQLMHETDVPIYLPRVLQPSTKLSCADGDVILHP